MNNSFKRYCILVFIFLTTIVQVCPVRAEGINYTNVFLEKISVDFAEGATFTSILENLNDKIPFNIVAYLGNHDDYHLTHRLRMKGSLKSVLDQLCAELGIGWSYNSECIIFSRIVASHERISHAQRVLLAWNATPVWGQDSLLKQNVIRFDNLTNEAQELWINAFGHPLPNDKHAKSSTINWQGISLYSDLNVIYSHKDSGQRPIMDRALARTWDLVGPLNAVISSVDVAHEGVFTEKEEQENIPGKKVSVPKVPDNFGNVDELLVEGRKYLQPRPGKVYQLQNLLIDIGKQVNKDFITDQDYGKSAVWVKIHSSIDTVKAMKALLWASQVNWKHVKDTYFFYPLKSSSDLPVIIKYDDLYWLSNYLGDVVKTADLRRLNIPFEKISWTSTEYLSLKDASQIQREWLRIGALGMTNVPLPWGEKYEKQILENPDNIVVRLLPRFRFRIASYAFNNDKSTPLIINSDIQYERADAFKWKQPVFKNVSYKYSPDNNSKYFNETEIRNIRSTVLEGAYSTDRNERYEACIALVRHSARKYAPILDVLSHDKDNVISILALLGLNEMGYLDKREIYQKEMQAYADSGIHESINAAIIARDTTKASFLLTLLDNKDASIRADATIALGYLQAENTITRLQSLIISDPDLLVRVSAECALLLLDSRNGQGRAKKVIDLNDKFDNIDPRAKLKILKTLNLIKIRSDRVDDAAPFIWQILYKAASDEDREVEIAALHAIVKFGLRSVFIPKLKDIYDHSEGSVRIAAAAAIIARLSDISAQAVFTDNATVKANMIWSLSREIAGSAHHGVLMPEHVLLAILDIENSTAFKIIASHNQDIDSLKNQIQSAIDSESFKLEVRDARKNYTKFISQDSPNWWRDGIVFTGNEVSPIIINAVPYMTNRKQKKLTSDAILYGIATLKDNPAGELLRKWQINNKMIYKLNIKDFSSESF